MKLSWLIPALALAARASGDESGGGSYAFCMFLWGAAQDGDTEELEYLLRHGLNVDCRGHSTALGIAAEHGHVKAAELLLQHGANVDAKDDGGYTPLHYAVREKNLQMAKLLMMHGASVVIRMDKINNCDQDGPELLNFLDSEEMIFMSLQLTKDCLRSMSKPVAKFWFEHGGNPWMSTPDELRYVYLIKDTEVRKYWQDQMTTYSLFQQTARDWKAWVISFGGLLAAGFALLLQKLLQKRQSPYRLILEEAATEPSFRMGARLLVAKHFGESKKNDRLAWRLLEVNANVVCQFGCVMLRVWWPFFLPLYGLAFAGPGLWRWGGKLVHTPPLMVASVTPTGTFASGVRWALVSSMAFYARFSNPLLARGELLDSKMSFLGHQHFELPWWLPMNIPWCPWWNHVTSDLTSWDAWILVVLLFWVPTVVLSAMYFGATLLDPCWTCCGEGSNSGATKEVQRDMVLKVLEHPSSEADGTQFIAVDGVRFTAEVGFSPYRFFESIWTKVLLVLLDIILDANTVFTLISAQQYRIALALQLVVSYSLLHQIMDGQIQRIFEAARASAARGLLRDDLIALLHQEHGFEAFFSLAITSYSLLFAVNTAAQIPVQVFSILLSVHGLATFLYEQVDLELAEDDEEVTSSDDEGTSSKASSGLEAPPLIQCMSY